MEQQTKKVRTLSQRLRSTPCPPSVAGALDEAAETLDQIVEYCKANDAENSLHLTKVLELAESARPAE